MTPLLQSVLPYVAFGLVGVLALLTIVSLLAEFDLVSFEDENLDPTIWGRAFMLLWGAGWALTAGAIAAIILGMAIS